jgi:uncharacterized protein YjbI with pentapeptide repeats
MAEDINVKKVRIFFDEKTKHIKTDKLSHAYLTMEFTDDDAKKCGLKNLDDLKSMFQAYCKDPQFSPSLDFPWFNPKEWINWYEEKPEKILRGWVLRSLLKFGVLSAGLGTLWVFGKFIVNLPAIEREKYFQAWQVINTAQGQPGLGGRKEALEYLNKETSLWYTPSCKQKQNNDCLVGIKIEEANLNGISLEGANLKSSEFRETSFRAAILKEATFDQANLEKARFKGANLEGAVFKDTNLKGAVFTELTKEVAEEATKTNLKGTRFEGANLTGADLTGANLEGAVFKNFTDTDKNKIINTNLTGANLTGANLTGAKFEDVNLKDAKFEKAYFCKTIMSNGKEFNRDCDKPKK